MNEEEKEAIKTIKSFKNMKWYNHAFDKGVEILTEEERREIDIIINLIDKQSKEIEKQQKEIEKLRNPVICGRNIDEIVNILMALDIEKQYKIEVTMENLKSLMGIYQAEVEKSIQNAQIKIVDDLLGKSSKIEFELPHFNFDEGE